LRWKTVLTRRSPYFIFWQFLWINFLKMILWENNEKQGFQAELSYLSLGEYLSHSLQTTWEVGLKQFDVLIKRFKIHKKKHILIVSTIKWETSFGIFNFLLCCWLFKSVLNLWPSDRECRQKRKTTNKSTLPRLVSFPHIWLINRTLHSFYLTQYIISTRKSFIFFSQFW